MFHHDPRHSGVGEGKGAKGAKMWEAMIEGINSSPAISQDGTMVYIGFLNRNSGGVYALVAKTGKKVWTFTTGDAVFSSPAISPDGKTVYIGSDDKNVYARNAATGEKVWTFTTDPKATVRSSAIDRNGVIYIGTSESVFATA
jgi:serine/threonine-protein kinase